MTETDSDLVRRCLVGDQDAFRLLVQRHERPVYYLIYRMVRNSEDASDLTQETFVKVFRALGQFDTSRNFSYWINKIASNATIDFMRKRKLRTVSIHPDPMDDDRRPIDLPDAGPLPDRRLAAGRRREQLEALVDRLAPHYRIVIHLRHMQQRSYDEIAEMLELPLGTVKARLHRAHNQLRVWLEGRKDSKEIDAIEME